MRSPSRHTVRARMAAALAASLAILVVLSGCGGDEPEASESTTPIETTAPATSDTSEPVESTSAEETTAEETTAEETTPVDDAVLVEVTVVGGQVTTTSDRLAVQVGQTVRITITSDVDDEVHVHGYNVEAELPAGQAVTVEVEIGPDPGPGLYEVETHETGLLLFQLEVR